MDFKEKTRILYRLNNKIIILTKERLEIKEHFYFRMKYIIQQKITSEKEFEYYKERSFYLAKFYYYGNEYSDNEMMEEFKKYLHINKLDI